MGNSNPTIRDELLALLVDGGATLPDANRDKWNDTMQTYIRHVAADTTQSVPERRGSLQVLQGMQKRHNPQDTDLLNEALAQATARLRQEQQIWPTLTKSGQIYFNKLWSDSKQRDGNMTAVIMDVMSNEAVSPSQRLKALQNLSEHWKADVGHDVAQMFNDTIERVSEIAEWATVTDALLSCDTYSQILGRMHAEQMMHNPPPFAEAAAERWNNDMHGLVKCLEAMMGIVPLPWRRAALDALRTKQKRWVQPRDAAAQLELAFANVDSALQEEDELNKKKVRMDFLSHSDVMRDVAGFTGTGNRNMRYGVSSTPLLEGLKEAVRDQVPEVVKMSQLQSWWSRQSNNNKAELVLYTDSDDIGGAAAQLGVEIGEDSEGRLRKFHRLTLMSIPIPVANDDGGTGTGVSGEIIANVIRHRQSLTHINLQIFNTIASNVQPSLLAWLKRNTPTTFLYLNLYNCTYDAALLTEALRQSTHLREVKGWTYNAGPEGTQPARALSTPHTIEVGVIHTSNCNGLWEWIGGNPTLRHCYVDIGNAADWLPRYFPMQQPGNRPEDLRTFGLTWHLTDTDNPLQPSVPYNPTLIMTTLGNHLPPCRHVFLQMARTFVGHRRPPARDLTLSMALPVAQACVARAKESVVIAPMIMACEKPHLFVTTLRDLVLAWFRDTHMPPLTLFCGVYEPPEHTSTTWAIGPRNTMPIHATNASAWVDVIKNHLVESCRDAAHPEWLTYVTDALDSQSLSIVVVVQDKTVVVDADELARLRTRFASFSEAEKLFSP